MYLLVSHHDLWYRVDARGNQFLSVLVKKILFLGHVTNILTSNIICTSQRIINSKNKFQSILFVIFIKWDYVEVFDRPQNIASEKTDLNLVT